MYRVDVKSAFTPSAREASDTSIDFDFRQAGRCFEVDGRRTTQVSKETRMEGIIYLVGLVVGVMFVLSFLGLR